MAPGHKTVDTMILFVDAARNRDRPVFLIIMNHSNEKAS